MKCLSRFVLLAVVMWIITFPLPVTAQDVLPSNETIVMNYLTVVYDRMDAADAVSLMTADAVFHDPLGDIQDVNAFVVSYHLLYDRVSRLKVTPYATIVEGDMVAVPYLWEGMTRVDSPNGLRTPVSGNGVEFFRMDNGKIAEIWRHTEWHDFSILGSEEDYRTRTYRVPTLVETSGIPMLTEMMHSPGLVETTGIPSLVDMVPSFTVPPITLEMLDHMPSIVPTPSESVVVRWLDSFNQGRINRDLMLPEFTFHTCPCDDGVGTMDLTAFVDNYQTAVADRGFAQWTPLVHGEGFTMASEGGLTALLYDQHYGTPFFTTEGITIFRVENGLLAEAWQF